MSQQKLQNHFANFIDLLIIQVRYRPPVLLAFKAVNLTLQVVH